MRYLLFIVAVWQSIWSALFLYAIFDGALRVAKDKGTLFSAYLSIATIVIFLPAVVLLTGWLIQRAKINLRHKRESARSPHAPLARESTSRR